MSLLEKITMLFYKRQAKRVLSGLVSCLVIGFVAFALLVNKPKPVNISQIKVIAPVAKPADAVAPEEVPITEEPIIEQQTATPTVSSSTNAGIRAVGNPADKTPTDAARSGMSPNPFLPIPTDSCQYGVNPTTRQCAEPILHPPGTGY